MALEPLSLLHHFASLPDPRVCRTRRHELMDLITIALCAVLSGAESWDDIADYGRDKNDWLATFLKLPNGIPSHDTFNRLFQRLDPEAFGACFASWMRSLAGSLGLKVIAIDGKALRHSFDTAGAKSALHLVSAWAAENHLTLGQVAVDGKSNEITALPKLLGMLDVAGAIVTIDAMGCQKDIALQIREGGADYILAVKGNQGRLYDDILARFESCLDSDFAGVRHSSYTEVEEGHGRKESRTTLVVYGTEGVRDAGLWKDLGALCMVVSERAVGEKSSLEARYYIGSPAGPAEEYAGAIRGHGGIENSLHWVLDVTFREDASRVRAGHAAENLARLRRIAVSLLRNETSCDRSIHGKRLKAGRDDDYLLRILRESPRN
jgi:predicted transposase YbfD/YdcC